MGVSRVVRTRGPLRCGPQQEFDFHRLVRKDDAPASRPVDDARIQECSDVAVYRLDVAANTARRLTDRDRSGSAQRFEKLPTLCRQHFPE